MRIQAGWNFRKGQAQIVLHILRRYVELRSVRALKVELDAAGIRSKHRTFADGTVYGCHKLSRGALYLMLQNRIYRGEITHKGNVYPGEHKAIVDKALWDMVEAVLAENRINRTRGRRREVFQPPGRTGLRRQRRTIDAHTCREEGHALSVLRLEVSYHSKSQRARDSHGRRHSGWQSGELWSLDGSLTLLAEVRGRC